MSDLEVDPGTNGKMDASSDSHGHDTGAPSLFLPENMLREARRQRLLPPTQLPSVCVLDPDGDLVAHAIAHCGAVQMEHWACYHSRLVTLETSEGFSLGLVGSVVGAPYAVMVAELMFASGCRFLVSIGSAGQIADIGPPPYFVLVDRAFRDEGTSAHYLPPEEEVRVDVRLLAQVLPALEVAGLPIVVGGSWTTDAPFRETEQAVAAARARGLLTVEMEAAGLYAFAKARQQAVLCLAYVTNRLGQPGDFDKGQAAAALTLVVAAAAAWLKHDSHREKPLWRCDR